MDILKLGTYKVTASGGQKRICMEIDTVTNLHVKYLYINCSTKLKQNEVRVKLTLNGTNIITDSLVSMNHYRTQYLDNDAFKFAHSSSASYNPNAPLFISFVDPNHAEDMGLPIYSSYTSNIKLEIFSKTAIAQNSTIDIYGEGRYAKPVKCYTGHFLLNDEVDTLVSGDSSYYKQYFIDGSNIYGFGYINSSRKSNPNIELLVENKSLFYSDDNEVLLNQGDLPKLNTKLSTKVHSSASSNIDLDSFNTTTELDDKTSGQNFKSGYALPYHVNEMTNIVGDNQSNKYVSQSWGILHGMRFLSTNEYTYRFSGTNYEVLPYYTRIFKL